MLTMKWFYATLAAFAVMFAMDYLWFQVLFRGFMESQMATAGQSNVPMHALGELCLAGLLAWTYPIGYKGGSATHEGVKFGLLMGLLYGLPNSIHMMASTGGSASLLFFFVANAVVVGVAGGVTVARVHGKASVA